MQKLYLLSEQLISSIYRKIPSWVWITGVFLGIHLPALTLLPVFADEAIYIRWAQLVIEDPGRFAFFSMADGKPPLFIWLLALFIQPFADPLFAGRLLSVFIGLATVFAVYFFTRQLTIRKITPFLSVILFSILPFWFFYHRMVLMDGLLVLCITLSLNIALHIARTTLRSHKTPYQLIPSILLLGVFYGAALYTKTPALFAIPVIALTPIIATFLDMESEHRHRNQKKLWLSFVLIGIGGFLGCCFFVLLRISPFFGALFSRGQDFTFTFAELLSGEWRYVVFESFPRILQWHAAYLTLPVFVLPLLGIASRRHRPIILLLIVQAALFALPLVAIGRVLWPRYFLPVGLLWTIAAALSLESFFKGKRSCFIGFGIVVAIIVSSLNFMYPAFTQVNNIPFVPVDQTQYLTEWSAGFGNSEVAQFIRSRRAISSQINEPKILVLTEGSFGTLPDGLTMYFQGNNSMPNLEIQGVGVSPNQLPLEYVSQVDSAEVYYVVNSHRFGIIDQSNLEKVFEIRRPLNGPSLLVFRVI